MSTQFIDRPGGRIASEEVVGTGTQVVLAITAFLATADSHG
jgi:hypothetical protein